MLEKEEDNKNALACFVGREEEESFRSVFAPRYTYTYSI